MRFRPQSVGSRRWLIVLGMLVFPAALHGQPTVTYPPVMVLDDGEPAFATLALTGSGLGSPSGGAFIYIPPNWVPSQCDCATVPSGLGPTCTAQNCILTWQDDLITARVSLANSTPRRSLQLFLDTGNSEIYQPDQYLYDVYDVMQQTPLLSGGSGPIAVAVDSLGRVWLDCEFHNDLKHLDPATGRVASIPIGYPSEPLFQNGLGTTTRAAYSGQDIFVDPYDRIWLPDSGGALSAGAGPAQANRARIAMYDPQSRTTRVYSVPGNDSRVFGVTYQSGIACSAGHCQDETLGLGGRSCSQASDCDRVWFTEQQTDSGGLTPIRPARLAWFDPRLAPWGDGTYDFPVDPQTQGCRNRECPDGSGRPCTEDAQCAAACVNGFCPLGSACSTDAQCATCFFGSGLCCLHGTCSPQEEPFCHQCQDNSDRACSVFSLCTPVCGPGECAAWPGRACFFDVDCARGSAGANGATACPWDEWSPGSDCFYHEYELPTPDVLLPAFLQNGNDGGVWFSSQHPGNEFGRLDPSTGETMVFPLAPPLNPTGGVLEVNTWDIKQAPPRAGEAFGDIVVSELHDGTVSRFDVERLYPPGNPADCQALTGDPPRNPCITELFAPQPSFVAAMSYDALGNLWFGGGASIGYVKPSSNEMVLFPPIATFPNNLARGEPATQSLSYYGARDATWAIDGNTDGNFANRSVTATAGLPDHPEMWWEVDLGRPMYIDQIRIWNRTDCCGAALNNFYIMGSDEKITAPSLDGWRDAAKWEIYQAAPVGSSVTRSVPLTPLGLLNSARYVRVQLAGAGVLSLAEVQVLSPPTFGGASSVDVDELTGDIWTAAGRQIIDRPPGPQFLRDRSHQIGHFVPLRRNLAASRPAAQSLSFFANHSASKAVDQNPDGDFFHNSSTLTANATQPWWQVDLGRVNQLQEVDVWAVNGTYGDPLRDFYVLVSDQPFPTNDLATLLANPNVSHYLVAGRAQRPSIVNVNRSGRYVRVQLTGSGAMAISEVMVLGSSTATCTGPTQVTACNDGNACTSDICRRGRCDHECRIGIGLAACSGDDTCQNDAGVCGCHAKAWPF